jgi:hypothetical protein
MRTGVEAIRAVAVGVGVCLGVAGCPAASDAGTRDAAAEHDAGASGVDRLVIGDHCPYPADPGLVPPRYSVRGGVEYWALEAGCIAVTHDPELAAVHVAQLQAAAAAFNAVACSRLCLDPPVARAFDPAALDVDLVDALASLGRRVHFMVDRRALPNGGLTEVYADAESGVMQSAFVFLPLAPADPLGPGDLLQLLGASLGLGATDASVDSVMSAERPQLRAALTVLDEALLCELYGAEPLCE